MATYFYLEFLCRRQGDWNLLGIITIDDKALTYKRAQHKKRRRHRNLETIRNGVSKKGLKVEQAKRLAAPHCVKDIKVINDLNVGGEQAFEPASPKT